VVANLPIDELKQAERAFLAPVMAQLPDKRLKRVVPLAIQGILAGQSPQITHMARGVAGEGQTKWPVAKRLYRFVKNPHFNQRDLLKGLYGIAQRAVAQQAPAYVLVALDPVNLEKPYTEKLEGVSTVMKSTPPGPRGEKRLTSGYPAMTATVVNLPEPVITYANWFSYTTPDFVSENREIYRAIRITRALLPQTPIRFVGDAGLDDQKIFRQVDLAKGEFIFRAGQDRRVEVYNERLDRWESELLQDLIATIRLPLNLRVTFTHARKTRQVDIQLGWLKIRLPQTQQILWMLVAHDPNLDHDVTLITNVPIYSAHHAQTVYREWRYRPRIEHTYRFDQERGLDVEDIQVRTLERMRRVFILVLLATLFVYHIDHVWPQSRVLWLRRLGGKLGHLSDRDGPYVLLAGISAVLVTAATLAFATHHPFPRDSTTCG
jgi:hypothetical protein